MFIRFARGDTAANSQVTAQAGSLLVDLEAKALHFHDGTSPGGYRANRHVPMVELYNVRLEAVDFLGPLTDIDLRYEEV